MGSRVVVQPGEVFSKDKVTQHTFAKRELPSAHELAFLFDTYDDWLDSRLERDRGAFVVSGLSKTGKTSMVEQSFIRIQKNPVTIQGKDISSIDSFWGSIADQLGVPEAWESGSKSSEALTAGGGVDAGIVRGSATAGVEEHLESRKSRRSLTNYEVSRALRESGRPLFIDDFHHCESDVAIRLSRELKSIVRDSLVVLIAIPAESFSPIVGTVDNAGRFEPIEIKLWSVGELEKIGIQGFKALGFSGSANSLAKIAAKEAFGSPQIMQELCLVMAQFLARKGVGDQSAVVEVQGAMAKILRAVAYQLKPQNMSQFIQGRPQKGKPRMHYSFSCISDFPEFDGSAKFDHYGVALLAMRELARNYEVQCDVSRLAEIVRLMGCDPSIDATRLGRPIGYLLQIAVETRGGLDPSLVKVGGGPGGAKDEIQIVDPYLAYYLANGDWITGAIVESA